MASADTIESPMNEHSEFGVVPPLHSCVARGGHARLDLTCGLLRLRGQKCGNGESGSKGVATSDLHVATRIHCFLLTSALTIRRYRPCCDWRVQNRDR